MNDFSKWHWEVTGKRVVETLRKNNFTADYFVDKETALAHVLGQISPGVTVGVGGSSTERAMGLAAALEKSGHTVYDHNKADLTPEQRADCRQEQLNCDVFITSVNAVTMKGELVNRDGLGNRVAAMIYGPKKVLVVVGVNKLVKDLQAADDRIRMVAAPLNSKRLNLDNPCVKTGHCADCSSPTRICNVTAVMHKQPMGGNVHVLLIGEELGY